ncbi:MAG: hypothetical protein ACOY6K_11245 [Pseudomonadota bacterium]
MLPGVEVLGTPGWLLGVFKLEPVPVPVVPAPMPVAVVFEPPGAELIPALPEFCGIELGALIPPGDVTPPAAPPVALPPAPVCAEAPVAVNRAAATIRHVFGFMTFSLTDPGRTDAGAVSFRTGAHDLCRAGPKRRDELRQPAR